MAVPSGRVIVALTLPESIEIWVLIQVNLHRKMFVLEKGGAKKNPLSEIFVSQFFN